MLFETAFGQYTSSTSAKIVGNSVFLIRIPVTFQFIFLKKQMLFEFFCFLNSDHKNFELALDALKILFKSPLHLCYQNVSFNTANNGINYHQFTGPHPAGLSSTHISSIYPVNLNRTAWTISYQDILSFGHLLNTNMLRTHKTIAVGGPSVHEPSMINARIGGNLDQLTAGKINDGSRVISGSIIFGHKSEGVMSYLGFYDSQISVIQIGRASCRERV